jgi:hypothetical protein
VNIGNRLIRPLLSWAFLSALVIIGVTTFVYLDIIAYARDTVGPMMGRGPSVSEEVNRITGLLSLAESCIGGLLVLAAIMLFWSIVTRHVPEVILNATDPRAIRLSLVIIPFAFAIAYALVRYAWYFFW